MKAHGFVNLRGTGTASTNEDSVWPSFTDVMMVIVMVFLMALVVILIRNVDLTDQLDKTERRAERDSAQKTALEMNIAGLGDEVVGLRLQLGEVTRRAELAQVATVDRDQQIGQLVQDVASLEQARDQLVRDNEALVGRESALQTELLSLEQTQQALLAVRGELEAEVTRLDEEKSGAEKEGRALSKTLTTVTRERDALLEDKAQLVKKQSALRLDIESMVARLATQEALLVSRQKELLTLSSARQALGEEKAAATEALRSRTSERDSLSLEKARLLEQGKTAALRLEVLAEEKREIAQQLVETVLQMQAYKGQVTALETRNKQLTEEGSQLKETTGNLITQTKQLQTDLGGRSAELIELTGEKRSLETRIQQLNVLKDRLTVSLAEMTDDRDRVVRTERVLQREKDQLLTQLTEAKQQQESGAAEIVRLRRQVVELDENEQALADERKVTQNVIERLEKKRTRMLQQAAALRAENAQLASDYLEAQRIQRKMREDMASYSKKLDMAEDAQRMSVQALATRKARYAEEITALQVEQRALVDELKGQYSELQVKYDRLVRPARTFLGKHVVRIGYWLSLIHI